MPLQLTPKSTALPDETSGEESSMVDVVETMPVYMVTITPREHELIRLVFEGLSNKEIAVKQCLAESTIKNRLSVVFEKLNLKHPPGREGMVKRLRENYEHLTRTALSDTMVKFTCWYLRKCLQQWDVTFEPEQMDVIEKMIASGFSYDEILNVNARVAFTLKHCLLTDNDKGLSEGIFLGLTNKGMEPYLNFKESTIKNKLSILFEKADVADRTQLPFRFLSESIEDMSMDPVEVLLQEYDLGAPIELEGLKLLFNVMAESSDRMVKAYAKTGLAILASIEFPLKMTSRKRSSDASSEGIRLVNELVHRIENIVRYDDDLRKFCHANSVMEILKRVA